MVITAEMAAGFEAEAKAIYDATFHDLVTVLEWEDLPAASFYKIACYRAMAEVAALQLEQEQGE